MLDQGESRRRRIIDAAYEFFYRCGFGRAGVDEIAEAARVTKRTLYHHFESKDALLAAVLEHQHELILERLRRWAMPSADATTMLDGVFAELKVWATQSGWQGSGFSRATMELADLPGHPARAAARRHKRAVEDFFREQFERSALSGADVLARQVMLLLEGCMLLILVRGDVTYADTAAAAARHLLEQGRSPTAEHAR